MYAKYKQLERDILSVKMDIRQSELKRDKIIELLGPPDVKALTYDYIANTGSRVSKDANLPERYNDLIYLTQYIKILERYLFNLDELKESFIVQVEKYNEAFNDLEMQIFYLHHIHRQPLNYIAKNMAYSYSHIKRINSGIVKKIKDDTKMIPTKKNNVI